MRLASALPQCGHTTPLGQTRVSSHSRALVSSVKIGFCRLASDMTDKPVNIVINRWPETENSLERLIGCLRVEYRARAAQRRAEEAQVCERSRPPQTVHIHMSDCLD